MMLHESMSTDVNQEPLFIQVHSYESVIILRTTIITTSLYY